MPSLLCSNMNHRFFLCAAAIVVLTIVSIATTATATATATASTATTTTTTTTLYPIKIKTKKGKRSSQNIKVLQQTNNELQTGDQDIWSNYIEFKKKHDSRFQFNIGDDITDITVVMMNRRLLLRKSS
jgi:curli biogenesis system outer membrane secretion channel CsgG